MSEFPFTIVESFAPYGNNVDLAFIPGGFWTIYATSSPVVSSFPSYVLPGRRRAAGNISTITPTSPTSPNRAAYRPVPGGGGSQTDYICCRYRTEQFSNTSGMGFGIGGGGTTGGESGNRVFIRFNAVGGITVSSNAFSSFELVPAKFHIGIWYFFEMLLTHNSPGADNLKIWVNGELLYDDTPGGNVGTVNRISLWHFGSNATNGPFMFTDIGYANDLSGPELSLLPMRDVCMMYLVPDADTAQANWLVEPNTNDGFEVLDNIPPSTSEYIYTANAGDKSIFDLEQPLADIAAVRCIAHLYRARKDAEAAAEMVGHILYPPSSVDITGSTNVLPVSFDYRMDFSYTNPATGNAWIPAVLDDLQIGYERTL